MHQQLILDKITSVLTATDDSYDERLVKMLDRAARVFIAGAGRSKLVASFFAMRLMHSGYDVSLVGEIVTPSIKRGDLLIIISGSGETQQLIGFTISAKEVNADILLITANSDSTMGDLADSVFQVGTDESYDQVKGMPMGTVFELSTLILLEAMISHVIHEKEIPEDEIRGRHANLE